MVTPYSSGSASSAASAPKVDYSSMSTKQLLERQDLLTREISALMETLKAGSSVTTFTECQNKLSQVSMIGEELTRRIQNAVNPILKQAP